jgi:hypothetical protein
MKTEDINRNNYETWFIDYLDGRLSDEQETMLQEFLRKNPDLKAELDGISGFSLSSPDGETMDDDFRSRLLKTPEDIPGISTLDQLCIARMEDDLSEDGIRAFDARLAEDEKLEARYEAFRHTRLQADMEVVYPGKKDLLHKTRVLTPWIITAFSSAAILVLALILWPRYQEPAADRLAGVDAAGTEAPALKPDTTAAEPATKPSAVLPEPIAPARDLRLAAAEPARKVSRAKTYREAAGEAPEKTVEQRHFVPMESLARSVRLTGVRIPEPQNDRLLLASAFPSGITSTTANEALTVPQYALRLFRERVLGEDRSVVKKTRFSVWEVAGAGVKKINDLAGTKMKLSREYDDQGDLLAISFNSKLVDIERPVRSQSAR